MEGGPEQKLKMILGEELEGKIAARISEFGGLLSRPAAVRLLCKQNGIETEQKIPLSDVIFAKLPFTFQARIDRIFPHQSYANGADRSVRAHISDGSKEATLVLWNEQAELVEGEISSGDTIECRGAYLRSGEIWVGRNGSVRRVAAPQPTPIAELREGICNVEGIVGKLEPDLAYMDKKTGQEKILASFQLCSNGSCRRVLVWPSDGSPRGVHDGDSLLLENVVFKNSEIHFNSFSRMVRKKSAQEKTATLSSISASESEARMTIGETQFLLPIEDALRLFGIASAMPGVSQKTLFLIKAQSAQGKQVKYRLDGNKLAWLAPIKK